jgi:hypothetical protein
VKTRERLLAVVLRLRLGKLRCVLRRKAPCQCPPFGTDAYFDLVNRPGVVFGVWTGEYDSTRLLAVFEDRDQAVRWGRRWEHAHRVWHDRATWVADLPFIPAGCRPPSVTEAC